MGDPEELVEQRLQSQTDVHLRAPVPSSAAVLPGRIVIPAPTNLKPSPTNPIPEKCKLAQRRVAPYGAAQFFPTASARRHLSFRCHMHFLSWQGLQSSELRHGLACAEMLRVTMTHPNTRIAGDAVPVRRRLMPYLRETLLGCN